MPDGYTIEFTSKGTPYAFTFKLHDGNVHIEAGGVLVAVWRPISGIPSMPGYPIDVHNAAAQVAAIQWVQRTIADHDARFGLG